MQTSSLVLTFLVMHVVVCHDNSDDGDDNYYVNVRMPGIIVNSAEEYFCAPQVLAQSDAYIVAFDVDTKPNTAHHILLYGCESPFSEGRYWKGTMGQPCGNGLSQILFGWALNAPPFHLPEGVAFWVGPAAKIGYLVVQIHYGAQLSEPNYSGIRVKLTRSKPKFAAGIYLFTLWPSPPIPARTPRFTVDTSCQFDGPVPIRPFAFRPHAHTLGRSIMAYLHNQTVRSSPTNATDWQGLDGWYLIGKGDPRLPETFLSHCI